jgi:membrane-bound lytic murein transglycosylase MltF
MVNAGIIRYTVMENDFVRYWSKVYKKLRPYPVCLKNHISFGWVFRKHSPQLKKSINAFLAHNGRRTLNGNYIYNKYVRTGSPLRHLASHKALKRLQKNRDLFVKHAKKYKLDWVLLAAQGYQESRLNSDKISVDGAVGIMQIKPSTARSKEVNIPDIYNNNNNIRAGAKYMHFLIAQYFNDKSISPMNKGLFALAAYNAGPTRIQYLRKRAAAYGINPNEWFNQVEIMVARDVGKETVQYVSNVYKYYISFRALKHYSKMSGKVVI